MRIVDLSMTLDDVIPVDPPFLRPKIDYLDHTGGLKHMYAMYGILPGQLLDEQGLASETLTLTTHSGTHVDAPWHYHPTMNDGERSWTIDEVPLDWFFRPGVKLDLRHLPNGHLVTAADIDQALDAIGHELQPLDIVLMHTLASDAYGREDYIDTGHRLRPRGDSPPHRLGRAGRRGRTPGAGICRRRSTGGSSKRPVTRRSSGTATRPAPRSATARSRSCRTSRTCRRPVSPWRASRRRCAAPPRAGRARSPSSRTDTSG